MLPRANALLDETHIFDGLNKFPTHVAHMRLGEFVRPPTPWSPSTEPESLYTVALKWLREDRAFRLELEKQGKKPRGGRRDEVGSPPAVL